MTEAPIISIVIPAYNAESLLPNLLQALQPWLDRPDVECIFVDDGSTDQTAHLLASESGIRLVSSDGNRGPAHARNLGVSHARGEVVFFIDADVIPDPDALDHVLVWSREHGEEVAVIGSYDANPDVRGLVGRFKNLFHRFVHQVSREDAGTFWTGCGAVRKEIFVAMGGFDAETYRHPSIEDIDFGVRLRHVGYQVRLDKDLLVKHRKDWTLGELIYTDVFRRGIPWTQLCLRYREMKADLNLRWDNRLSVLCVAGLLVASFLGGVGLTDGVLAGSIGVMSFGVYGLLNFSFFRFLARADGWVFALRCVPLHLLYCGYCGLAFMLGVLTFPWASIRTRPDVSVIFDSTGSEGGGN